MSKFPHFPTNKKHNEIPKTKETKPKINKWDSIELKSLRTGKGSYQKNEKASYQIGENYL